MNAIIKAIDDCTFTIPKQILDKVFINRYAQWRSTAHTSVRDEILNTIVKPRVLVDCNLIGGVQATIPLSNLSHQITPNNMVVVHIPKSATQGRTINSVLNVSFVNPFSIGGQATSSGYGDSVQGSSSSVVNAAYGVMQAASSIPVTSTASVQLIAENTVLIRDTSMLPPNSHLRCILSNDENMSNIQLRSYRHFSKLVIYAVKAYIYNELVVQIDQAELQGGQALGVFKDIVTSYSEAELMYQDYLRDVWEAVALMNDDMSYTRYIKMIVGGSR